MYWLLTSLLSIYLLKKHISLMILYHLPPSFLSIYLLLALSYHELSCTHIYTDTHSYTYAHTHLHRHPHIHTNAHKHTYTEIHIHESSAAIFNPPPFPYSHSTTTYYYPSTAQFSVPTSPFLWVCVCIYSRSCYSVYSKKQQK